MHNTPLNPPNLPVGAQMMPVANTRIYIWATEVPISVIFPDGIPIDRDAQLCGIYNWVKSYTGMPFEDVLEE